MSRASGENVGTYPIGQGTLALSSNYALTYVGANLVITKATLTVTADNKTKTLNAPNPTFTANYSGFKNGDTLTTNGVITGSPGLTTTATTTSPVGSYPIAAAIGTLAAGNYQFSFVNGVLTVTYAPSGTCNGDVGHAILQPINPDGTSVFKQGSTVPAKFRVCDANGVSIGTPGVVTSFYLTKTSADPTAVIDEAVISTTPDTAFRWDSTAQQWIFNMGTKSLKSLTSYYYTISLNDGSTIKFNFALK